MTWANYIGDDLRLRVSQGRDVPEKLTLQTLSSLYKVSITPVRIAVEQLLGEGVLFKGTNGRLAVNPERLGGADESQPSAPPRPPRDHFDLIARDMVKLSLSGKPIELRELEIADKHGIGTRRVREIFHRLAGLGMVEHLPRRGWRLVPFSEEALNEYADARMTLEMRALELAMPYLVRADLERLRQENLDQAASSQPLVIDNAIHNYIIEKSRNRYIQGFIARHHPYFELLLDYETSHPAILNVRQLAANLHVEIIDALIQGDLEAAKAALAKDLSMQHPLLDMYRHAQQAMQTTTP